jgi:hypothetical protein
MEEAVRESDDFFVKKIAKKTHDLELERAMKESKKTLASGIAIICCRRRSLVLDGRIMTIWKRRIWNWRERFLIHWRRIRGQRGVRRRPVRWGGGEVVDRGEEGLVPRWGFVEIRIQSICIHNIQIRHPILT